MRSSQTKFVYLLGEGLSATVIDSQVIRVLQRLGEKGIIFDLLIYQPYRMSAALTETLGERLMRLSSLLPGKVSYRLLPAWLLSGGAERDQAAEVSVAGFSLRDAVAAGGLDSEFMNSPFGRRFDTVLGKVRSLALNFRATFVSSWVLYKIAAYLLRGQPVVMHARSSAIEIGTVLRRLFPQLRLVADFRGDSVAEYVYSNVDSEGHLLPRHRRVCGRFADNERKALRIADSVQCVSKPLARRLLGRWPGGHDPRVIPCLADERLFYFDTAERDRLRSDLRLGDATALIYCGSMASWQVPDRVLDLYKSLKREDVLWKLIIVTPDTEDAKQLAGHVGLEVDDDVVIRSARHDEIRGYLLSADVALLLRDAHPLNQVASPTKFAEYTMCGLPVVTSCGIGDLDQLVQEHELGVLLNSFSEGPEAARRARQFSMQDRERLASRARTLFSLESFIDNWAEVYRNVYSPAT